MDELLANMAVGATTAVEGTFPLNTPILVTGPRMAAGLGLTGTLRDAYLAAYAQGASVAIVVRVNEGTDAAGTRANVVGNPTTGTGIHALMNAASATGQTPRILATPGFTSSLPAAGVNPVVSALLTVAARTRAVVVAAGRWIEANQDLVLSIGAVATALVGLNLATLAARWGFWLLFGWVGRLRGAQASWSSHAER